MISKEKQDYEEIISNIKNIRKLFASASEKQIVGVVGASGSGKSVLISLLLQANIQFQRISGGRFTIQHGNNNIYPQIGNKTAQSCTTMARIYKNKGVCYVDLAGWFDSRQPTQQIKNAYSNAALFTQGKQIKIIIVVQISTLQNNKGGQLVDIFHRLQQFFKQDIAFMMNSTVLVISKINVSDWSMVDLQKQITEIKDTNKNFSDYARILLESLITNKRVFMLPRPDQWSNHLQLIRNKLNQSRATVLRQNCQPTLSNAAKNMVNNSIRILDNNILQCSRKICNQIRLKCKNMVITTGQKANQQLCKLKKAKTILNKQIGSFGNAQDQNRVVDDFTKALQISVNCCQQLKLSLTMCSFYSRLNGLANLQDNFIKQVTKQLDQDIASFQIIRQKFTSEQDRKLMEQKHKQQMIERQKQNMKLMEQHQQKMEKAAKQHRQHMQQQNKAFRDQIKEMNQRHDKKNEQMNRMIVAALNKPPQIIHRNRGGGLLSTIAGWIF